ncbi:MAG: hypothetical protein FJ254_06140 [Phycisphaerae bacterium]|nr:hypothetical protein [Phycisphaerae bacterium]
MNRDMNRDMNHGMNHGMNRHMSRHMIGRTIGRRIERVNGRRIGRLTVAALLVIVGAVGCGPPAHVLDRVSPPIRPAWLATQPESQSLTPASLATLDRDHDRYGATILAVRTQRLAALANAVKDVDPRTVDPDALRRWIAEARATRTDLDAADASLFGDLASTGVINKDLAGRWSLRRRVERERDLLAQAGFGSPPDVAKAMTALPPPGWDAARISAWADDDLAWIAPRLAALNNALLVRPLERRLAPTPAPNPDGSPGKDPIDESFNERVRTLSAECTARAITASDDAAWRTAIEERLKPAASVPPSARAPSGARYAEDAGSAALFLPPPPTDAEWTALEKAASIESDALSPLRTAWESTWTAAVQPIAEFAKFEIDRAQASTEDPASGSPRELAQRIHGALESAIRDVHQVEAVANDQLFAALRERTTPDVIAWWQSMRAAPPRASDAPGAGLARAFGMGACRRDRALVELSALTVATPTQRDAVLRTIAATAPDQIALARELDRARLVAWRSVFESQVIVQRDPLALNPTLTRAALASSAEMSNRFVVSQVELAKACARAVPELAQPMRDELRALAWPEFFAPRGADPVDQQRLITVRPLMPASFQAEPLDAAIERELERIDAQSGRTPWTPGTPFSDPEGDWAAILRRDPALFGAVWARTVTTDRAVRDAALDLTRRDRAPLREWLERAAHPVGP